MNSWEQRLRFDPALPIEESNNLAIKYFYQTDILGKSNISLEEVWKLKQPVSVLKKQQPNGSWQYMAKPSPAWTIDYEQYETYKQLAKLVDMYGFDNNHSAISETAEYFLNNQSEAMDIRGIYGNQYSPNYTAQILELLVRAGYSSDKRVIRSYDWLMMSRQDDGGWALAFRTKGINLKALGMKTTIEPDTSKPSSHLITGIVLRALSIHPKYNSRQETLQAADLLASRFFKRDAYPDRQAINYWTRFSYPLFQTDIISSLDALSRIGTPVDNPNVEKALRWIESHQNNNGTFDNHLTRGNDKDLTVWINLAICRIYKRLFT